MYINAPTPFTCFVDINAPTPFTMTRRPPDDMLTTLLVTSNRI